MAFDLHENETACRTHFHMKGFALKLVWKRGTTRKWPIVLASSTSDSRVLKVLFWVDFVRISPRYRRGRYLRVTYKGKSRIIRRITRRFKVRVGLRWRYIVRRRGKLVLRFRRRYRQLRLTGGRLMIRYGRRWKVIWRKPRRPRRTKIWRRRRRRRRRRRVRRRRRRYRRRRRRIRRRNVLRFKYGRRWIPAYRRGRYLRCRIRGTWRKIR